MDQSIIEPSDALTISVERMIWFCYLVKIEAEYSQIPCRTSAIPPNLTRFGTMVFLTASFFYSLFDDDKNSVHLGKIWKNSGHPFNNKIKEIEDRLAPFKKELQWVRNRIGFHGSRNRDREKAGIDIFNVEGPRGREFARLKSDMQSLAREMIKWYTDQLDKSFRPDELWKDFLIELEAPSYLTRTH
jgi:hypothetical protein